MPDRRLTASFRGVAEALLPDVVLTQERAVGGAINADATVRADALTGVLPWQRVNFRLFGVAPAGTSQGGIFEMPQGAVIRHIAMYARVAPSTAPFTATITGGTRNETVSIPAGNSSDSMGTNIMVAPGAALRLDVLQGGGAEDVTISIHYVPGGA